MNTEPFHITDTNFDETVKNNKLVLVDFWAGWCGPCRALAPIFSDVSSQYEGKVKFVKIDIEKNQHLAEKYKIMSIPMLAVFKNGDIQASKVGSMTKDAMSSFVELSIA